MARPAPAHQREQQRAPFSARRCSSAAFTSSNAASRLLRAMPPRVSPTDPQPHTHTLPPPPPPARLQPRSHTIIEAHPDVYAHACSQGWDKRPGVRLVQGRWQDVIDQVGAGLGGTVAFGLHRWKMRGSAGWACTRGSTGWGSRSSLAGSLGTLPPADEQTVHTCVGGPACRARGGLEGARQAPRRGRGALAGRRLAG